MECLRKDIGYGITVIHAGRVAGKNLYLYKFNHNISGQSESVKKTFLKIDNKTSRFKKKTKDMRCYQNCYTSVTRLFS